MFSFLSHITLYWLHNRALHGIYCLYQVHTVYSKNVHSQLYTSSLNYILNIEVMGFSTKSFHLYQAHMHFKDTYSTPQLSVLNWQQQLHTHTHTHTLPIHELWNKTMQSPPRPQAIHCQMVVTRIPMCFEEHRLDKTLHAPHD